MQFPTFNQMLTISKKFSIKYWNVGSWRPPQWSNAIFNWWERLVMKLQKSICTQCLSRSRIDEAKKLHVSLFSDFCISQYFSDGHRPPLPEPVRDQSFWLLLLLPIDDLLCQIWNQSWLLFVPPCQQFDWFGMTSQNKVFRPHTQQSQFPNKDKCSLFENLGAYQVPDTPKNTVCYPEGFILDQFNSTF